MPRGGDSLPWLPEDLPLPPGTREVKQLRSEPTFDYGALAVPLGYRDFTAFVLEEWPEAGWVVARGETEPGEAESSFLQGTRFGSFAVRATYCDDGWSELFLVFGDVPDEVTATTTTAAGGPDGAGGATAPAPPSTG